MVAPSWAVWPGGAPSGTLARACSPGALVGGLAMVSPPWDGWHPARPSPMAPSSRIGISRVIARPPQSGVLKWAAGAPAPLVVSRPLALPFEAPSMEKT